MKIFLTSIILYFTISSIAFSQSVGINSDNSLPDESAILHLKSSEKGILIPRMNTSQRLNIQNPAQGLMVFDGNESRFYYFDSGEWKFLADQDYAIQELFVVGDSIGVLKGNERYHLNEINHWNKKMDTLQSVNNIVRIKSNTNSTAILLDDDKTSINNNFNLIKTERQWLNLLIDSNNDQENAHFAIYNNSEKDTSIAQLFIHFDGDDSWINSSELGLGLTEPSQRLDINGAIRIRGADTTNLKKGTIRFNSDNNDFEGWNGIKWLSLTYGNPGSDVVYNQTSSHPMADDTQFTLIHPSDKQFGRKLEQVGDYAFARYSDGNPELLIKVLKNNGGQWNIDTTLTYQGTFTALGTFGFGMVADSSRLAISKVKSGYSDISIYTVDDAGIELEQIIPIKSNIGLGIHNSRLVASSSDTIYIYELDNTGVWVRRNTMTGSNKVSVWNDRMVRAPHDLFSVDPYLTIWHKIGNVWGQVFSDSIGTDTHGHDMYGQFYAISSSNEFIVYKYENGTYSKMSLPPETQEFLPWMDVKLFEDYMIVGTSEYDFQGSSDNDGIARIFKYNGTGWDHIQDITDPFADTEIGVAVSTDGVNYIIGAPDAPVNGAPLGGKLLLGPVNQ